MRLSTVADVKVETFLTKFLTSKNSGQKFLLFIYIISSDFWRLQLSDKSNVLIFFWFVESLILNFLVF